MPVLKVCLIGADSTGKTTLAERLAKHYETEWVPEYARELIEAQGGQFTFDDMINIVEGQLVAEARHALNAKELMFCDGSPLANCVWSERYFGKCHPRVVALAGATYYDLYLLTRADVSYEVNPIRDSLEWREWLDARFLAELQRSSCKYVSIEGGWEQRFQSAVRAVDDLLNATS